MPKKKKPTIKDRVLKLVDFDYYVKHTQKQKQTFVDDADNAWLREFGDDYIWCITSETQKHHVIAIWGQHRLNEGGHAVLEALDELMAENVEVIGR